MKYLIVLSCLLVVAYGIPPDVIAKIKEQLSKISAECKTETGASDDDVAPIKKHETPTSTKGKCFLACMNKKFGFQDEDGKMDPDMTYALIDKMKMLDEELFTKMKQVAENCFAELSDAADECETAGVMFTCFQKQNKVVGFEPIDFST